MSTADRASDEEAANAAKSDNLHRSVRQRNSSVDGKAVSHTLLVTR